MVHRLPREQIELLARHWQHVYEQSGLGIILVHPQTNLIQAVNPAFARQRGYEPRELVGVPVSALYPQRLHEETARRIEEINRGGHSMFESVHVRKDGGEMAVLVDVTLIRDKHQRPVSRVACVLDISDRKRAESALRDSEQRFVRFMHHLPGLAWIKDLEGRYIYANAAAERAFGLSLAELYGRTDEHVFPPETARQFRANDELALASSAGVQITEALRHGSDNELHHSLVSKFPMLDSYGRVVMTGGIAIDMTARLKAEQAMSDSETRFRLLADNLPSIVWTTAADGTVTYANQRWFDFTGARRPDDSRWPQLQSHPDDQPRARALWAEALGAGTAFELEVRLRRHDGAYRWFLSRAVPQRDAAGAIVRWVGVSTDIHEQKELHERLRDADRRKDEFIATLAHELRSPLAAVCNTADWLPAAPRTAEETQHGLDIIRRQAGILSRLVEDLLDLSRISRGQLRLRKERMELGAVLGGAVEALRPLFDASRHLLFVSLPPEPVWFEADPVRVSQIVGNLLTNAATYTPDRGRIELSAAVEDGHAVIRVQDTGVGIHADMVGHIFEPFAQAHDLTPRAPSAHAHHPGLGIGLAISRQLVELHGGTIEVESAGAGAGSRFTVRLPVTGASAEAPTQESKRRGAAAPAAGRRVLVVDDNRDAARILGLVLQSMGHQAMTARDGEEALKIVDDFRPHAVLLDIGLPKIDGYEVARRLRQRPDGKSLLLVAVTGWGQEQDRARSADAGFDHHLVKPVDPQDLRRLLAAIPGDTAHNVSGGEGIESPRAERGASAPAPGE